MVIGFHGDWSNPGWKYHWEGFSILETYNLAAKERIGSNPWWQGFMGGANLYIFILTILFFLSTVTDFA